MLDGAFADIAAGFSAMLGGPFEPATLSWPGVATYDDGGSITAPGNPFQQIAQVQFDTPTEQMRSDPGFIERDMRLLVLRAGLGAELTTRATLIVSCGRNAGTWSIETCQGDTAGIGWECRARKLS